MSKNSTLKSKKISQSELLFSENKKIFNKVKKGFKIKNFHGLAIDSRVVKKNNIFLTITGKNNDGTKFVSKALKKGAQFIISSKKIKSNKSKLIKVDSEIKFLNKFALTKRNNTKAKILAITGSAGKTSLKNLIKDLLQNFGKTHFSPKSYNNHFGVPLTLSNLENNHKYGVFEVGMSKPGEIDALTKLIKPHIGIITNIGEAHIENFKNTRGIADAKGEMIKNIKKEGTIILNHDDNYFNYFKAKAKLQNLKVVTFGMSSKSDVYPIKLFKKNIKTKQK